MVLLIILPSLNGYNWEYTLFSDIPIWLCIPIKKSPSVRMITCPFKMAISLGVYIPNIFRSIPTSQPSDQSSSSDPMAKMESPKFLRSWAERSRDRQLRSSWGRPPGPFAEHRRYPGPKQRCMVNIYIYIYMVNILLIYG